jgi:1-deoxy-D-xylulose-5-phosphate synthase
MDHKYLKTIISRDITKVISIEEGVIEGGFGEGVSSFLLENGYQGELKRCGLPDSYVQHGSRAQILNQLSLDELGINNTILELFNEVKETQ